MLPPMGERTEVGTAAARYEVQREGCPLRRTRAATRLAKSNAIDCESEYYLPRRIPAGSQENNQMSPPPATLVDLLDLTQRLIVLQAFHFAFFLHDL